MLYQKYRPTTFENVVGNRQVVESLQELTRSKQRPHSYLFQGPRGCGKTTLARICARMFGATDIDIVEINAANETGVEGVRAVTEGAAMVPMFSKARVYIYDEAHKLSDGAQSALLKITEDCPEQAYFFFCTTDPQKLKATLRDRCASYTVQQLRSPELRQLIDRVAATENIKVDEEVSRMIADASQGSPRSALMILEQVAHIPDKAEVESFIQTVAVTEKTVLDVCKELVTVNPARWTNCHRYLQSMTLEDPESFRLAILKYLQKCLLGTTDYGKQDRYIQLITVFEHSLYNNGGAGLLAQIYRACLIDD